MQSRTVNQLSISLNESCSLYIGTYYNVEVILIYMEFDPVAAKFSHVQVNMAAASEHMG